MDQELHDQISDWKRRVSANQEAHYNTALKFSRYHYGIGLPATILTTIAGATLLAEAEVPWIRIAVGVVGLIAAVLTAIQTFYSHAKRSEAHRSTAAQFGQVRRDIEMFEMFPPRSKEEMEKRMQEIDNKISKIDEVAPPIGIVRTFVPASLLCRINTMDQGRHT